MSASIDSRPAARRPLPPSPSQARFWNRVARKYAADPIADPEGYETTLRRVASLLQPGHSVLEVGCGTGTTALRLAARCRRYLATDVADAMVAIAREKLAANPVPQLRFEQAEAGVAPPDGERFDRVLAFNLLHLVADLDGVLRGLVGSLKPGGLLVSKTPCVAEMNPLVPRVLIPLMRTIGKAPPVLSFDAAQLGAAFERNGLAIETVERHGTRGRDIRVFIVARRRG